MLFVLPEVFTLVLGPSFDLPCLLATAILDSFFLFYPPNITPSRDGRPNSLGIGASRSFWLLPAELGRRAVFSLFYPPNSLFCIRFWLLGDKNQVLFISVSPVPSMELRKQWMLHQGLLTGRRTESLSGRRMQNAYWERKLESSILTKRNPMTFCITEQGLYVATMPCFSSSLWAFLIAQLVKNLPAMPETPVQFLGREDPLEKGKATHSSILA